MFEFGRGSFADERQNGSETAEDAVEETLVSGVGVVEATGGRAGWSGGRGVGEL